jgi:hypothetical protein
MTSKLYEEFVDKIIILNQTSWEGRVSIKNIDNWLENFEDDDEKIHALHLLTNFMYFGSRPIRELLKTLFRDIYKYPIVERIRRANSDTRDLKLIDREFADYMDKTRFIGIGNPSESGPHLLYYFRQENKLSKQLFINAHEIFKGLGTSAPSVADPNVEHYVFIDDFCGSGTQALDFAREIIVPLKNILSTIKPNATLDYYVLFSTQVGKNAIKASNYFSNVKAVFTLDDSFKCFHPNSRYFLNVPSEIKKSFSEKMSIKHGSKLYKSIFERMKINPSIIGSLCNDHALGYENGQLLIGFHHNTPDNTLPIIWYDEEHLVWTPIFKRYNKKYG